MMSLSQFKFPFLWHFFKCLSFFCHSLSPSLNLTCPFQFAVGHIEGINAKTDCSHVETSA